MLLDLNKLHGQREHLERTFEPAAFDPQDIEYRVAAPVELTVDVQKLGGDAFAVAGRVKARLEVVCSRCLEPFEVPLDTEFDLRYVPQAANAGEGEREIGEDDLVRVNGMLAAVQSPVNVRPVSLRVSLPPATTKPVSNSARPAASVKRETRMSDARIERISGMLLSTEIGSRTIGATVDRAEPRHAASGVR